MTTNDPDTRPFGYPYPAPLQAAVDDAERVVDMLERLLSELAGSRWVDPASPTDAEVWIEGRDEEATTYVAEVVREWRSGRLSTEFAAASINGYVRALRAGFEAAFGRSLEAPRLRVVPEAAHSTPSAL